MKKHIPIKYFAFILLTFLSASAYAQVTCEPNEDFGLGNFNFWKYYEGTFTSSGGSNPGVLVDTMHVYPPSSQTTKRFTITNGASTDFYGGFPIADPTKTYSLKIGFDSQNYCVNKARYEVHVPAGTNDYALIYRYAIVMEDPGHIASQQPRFLVKSTDSATGTLLPCGNFTYVAGSLPGFSLSNQGTNVYYKSWSTASLNLSGYAGKTITVEFEAVDCALGGHWGYGYIDMTCGLFEITKVKCSYNASTTLTAPPGFQTYLWYDSSYSTTIGSGDTISFATPSSSKTYHVICTPFSGYGCPDTLTTNIIISNLAIQASNDTTICNGSSASLISSGTGGNVPLSYSWTPSTGLSCNTCSSPFASPSSTTKYFITINDSTGCGRTDSVLVSVNYISNVTTDPVSTTTCENTTATFTAAASGTPTPTVQWQLSTNGGSSWGNISGATSNTYSFTCSASQNGNEYRAVYSNTCGNDTSAAATLHINTVPVVTTDPTASASACSGSTVSISAAASGTPAPTVQWQVSTNGGSTWSNISGATSTTYSFTASNTVNNNQYRAIFTNTCGHDTSAVSVFTLSTPLTPSVSIAPNPNSSICPGTPVTFTATPTNGGSTPAYQWKKNNVNVGTNSATYTDNSLTNSDVITCVMTSNGACVSPSTATSNAVSMTINPLPSQPGTFTTSSAITYQGQAGVVYTVPSVSGVTYSWSYSGTGATINGSGNSVTVDFSTSATSGNLCVTATTTAGCGPSASRCISITVKPYETWTCGANNDWNNPANWDGGFVPYGTISALIPSGTPCSPNVCSSNANVYNITVDNGASVNICCSYNVIANHDITLNGSVLGCGYLTMAGSACHVIYGKGRVDNFELSNSCGGIINSGDTLHIGKTYKPTLGVMTVNGELELLSDATATAVVLTHPGTCANYINGDVICDKYIHGGIRAFRFLGHPFTASIGLNQLTPYMDITGQGGSANGFTTTTTNNPSAFWYNTLTGTGSASNDIGWTAFTNTNGAGANAWNRFEGIRLMFRGTPGQGLGCNICVPDPVTIKMHGPINECDEVVTLATNANLGYNFVGNPYPCNIDLSFSARGSSIGANFSVWDPNQGIYGAYVDQPFNISYVLPAYSAFFTTCNAASNNTITFHEGDKTASPATGNLFKTTSGFGNNVVQLHILSNNDSLSWDRLLLFFNGQTMAGLDNLDGQKLYNPGISFYTYSADNSQLSIDVRPYVSNQVIQLGLQNADQMDYAIRVDDYDVPAGATLYLHDKYLNQVQALSQGMHYNFSVTSDPASQGDNRFELNLSGTTSVSSVTAGNGFKVNMMPNPATDNATISFEAPQSGNTVIRVSSVTGQVLYTNALGDVKNGKVVLALHDYAPGIYIVNVSCGSYSVTQRLVKQ